MESTRSQWKNYSLASLTRQQAAEMDCQPAMAPSAPTAYVHTILVLRIDGGTDDLQHCCCGCCCWFPTMEESCPS